MPFTLAHPAAALPIWHGTGRRWRLAALVLGSAAPDFEYFLHLNTHGRFGHTIPGLFLLSWPAAWAALWLFDRWGRFGVARLLPAEWVLPTPAAPTSPVLTSVALLTGGATHLFWDAFTHASGWGLRVVPTLGHPIAPALGLAIPWYKLLQHGSTVLGLALLGWAAWCWARRQPTVPLGASLRRGVIFAGVLILAGVINGFRASQGTVHLEGIKTFVVAGGVGVTLALGLSLLILGMTRPRLASSPRGAI